ncbi:polyprenyl synthetase family protein [bacterium]|nr:polyprenyl synthetase family protein [bacterium]
MDKSRYFDLMRETSEEALPLIRRHIDSLREVEPELHGIMRYVLDRRNGELMLKPFLLRLTYELCGGTDWHKTIPVGAAFEMLNLSSYQANAAFDDKHAVLSTPQKWSQFMAAMITRELALECLAAAEQDFAASLLDAVRTDLSTCNKHIYIAQHYDMNVLNLENLGHYADRDAFLVDYNARCYHGSGVFNGNCARAGAILAGASANAASSALRYGEEFGTGIQVMNDLADFVPPGVDGVVGRGFQDQLSDIRNGRLTFGCYLLFREEGRSGEDLLSLLKHGDGLNERELQEVAALLVNSGALDTVTGYAKGFSARAKDALSGFPDSLEKSALSLMVRVCHDNKFVKALRKCSSEKGEVL